MNPLISIIVPVYNTAHYLPQCLDSLIHQTYSNIEIIAVNDGSTDDSGIILEEYAERDRRFMVIHKSNTGVSDSRNLAIDNSKGEFLIFVDSDDWLDLETCEQAVLHIKDAEVLLFSYVREYENLSRPKMLMSQNKHFDENECALLHRRMIGPINEEIAHPEMLDAYGTIWGKMYRREIIEHNHIRFIDLKEIGTAEDTLFNIDLFRFVKCAFYLNASYYHYRKSRLSSCTSSYKAGMENKHNILFGRILSLINGLDPVYKKALSNRIALSITGLGLNVLCKHDSFRNKRLKLTHILSIPPYSDAVNKLSLHYLPSYWSLFFFSAQKKYMNVYFILLYTIKKIIRL